MIASSPRKLVLCLLVLASIASIAPIGCRSTHEPVTIEAGPTHAQLATQLSSIIESEIKQKDVPAFSIALMDRGSDGRSRLVWARGFGEKTPGRAAGAQTVHRVGSVSKLFTDIAVLQLVEEGRVDLDKPVSEYLDDFRPENPYDKKITLRQLMCHQSGLVREPPSGHYFDPEEPSLATCVRSLNDTKLVYEPETRLKYSNAGIAVVGRVLEVLEKKPFAQCIEDSILGPLAMTHSSFELDEKVAPRFASSKMWTYHGGEFDSPTFKIGTSAAGNLFSSAIDQAKFIEALLAGADSKLLQPETLEKMYEVQFAGEGATRGFGLGFYVSRFDGHRRVGHSGAVYGFSTTLAVLPDDGIGVIAVASRDVTNNLVGRIADHALRGLLALRDGKEGPKWRSSDPVEPRVARALAGSYENDQSKIELVERQGRLFLRSGWIQSEVRRDSEGLLVDGRVAHGARLGAEVAKDATVGSVGEVRVNDTSYRRSADTVPAACPDRWRGLIGEYGWDHNVLFILEKDGALYALIEWIFLYPLTEESENVFAFPKRGGLYHGEKLIFERDASGRATRVVAASVGFERRDLATSSSGTFRIEPVVPIEHLRRVVPLSGAPPVEERDFSETDFVEAKSLAPSLRYDIRYATTNNFMGAAFYEKPHAFLQRPAAEALARAQEELRARGLGILIYDAYRPWHVTKMFWDATPEKQKHFVADPSKGSRHNRGCAVDITLVDLETGEPVPMSSGYDEFNERAYPQYPGGTSRERYYRRLVKQTMQRVGFSVYKWEWWHFDFDGWERYRIHNLTFDAIPSNR